MPVEFVSEKSVWMPRRSQMALPTTLPSGESPPLVAKRLEPLRAVADEDVEVRGEVERAAVRLEHVDDDRILGDRRVDRERVVAARLHLEAVHVVVVARRRRRARRGSRSFERTRSRRPTYFANAPECAMITLRGWHGRLIAKGWFFGSRSGPLGRDRRRRRSSRWDRPPRRSPGCSGPRSSRGSPAAG